MFIASLIHISLHEPLHRYQNINFIRCYKVYCVVKEEGRNGGEVEGSISFSNKKTNNKQNNIDKKNINFSTQERKQQTSDTVKYNNEEIFVGGSLWVQK